MAVERTRPKAWTKPLFKRLGELKDIRGAQGAGDQAAGVKT